MVVARSEVVVVGIRVPSSDSSFCFAPGQKNIRQSKETPLGASSNLLDLNP